MYRCRTWAKNHHLRCGFASQHPTFQVLLGVKHVSNPEYKGLNPIALMIDFSGPERGNETADAQDPKQDPTQDPTQEDLPLAMYAALLVHSLYYYYLVLGSFFVFLFSVRPQVFCFEGSFAS